MANHSEVDAHCKVNMKTEVGEVAEVEEARETLQFQGKSLTCLKHK